MSATISEVTKSRPFTYGGTTEQTVIYIIVGTTDDAEVYSLLGSTAPTVFNGLIRENYEGEPLGNGVWIGRVTYQKINNNNEYTFKTGGGTQKITQALHTTIYDFVTGYDYYGDDVGTGPDFGGAIGVDGDKVEGVDITVPAYEFSETHYIAEASVTDTYKQTLAELTGKVCNSAFKGFQGGEVIFNGATGALRGDGQWGITFDFAVSRNASGLEVGGITGIDKDGWDYLWVYYEDFEDEAAYAIVKRPVAVYVSQVYYRADFSALGIGT